jgi:ankyrin repeat protein
MTYDYMGIHDMIHQADLAKLGELANDWNEFPAVNYHPDGSPWIIEAIQCGNSEVVAWMLQHGATPKIKVNDGYTALHCAIERSELDKFQMMRDLIAAGADVNEIGIHGYTPGHLAAVLNDVEALKILYQSGADFSIKTSIDDYFTPLEEARSLKGAKAAEAIHFLETLECDHDGG